MVEERVQERSFRDVQVTAADIHIRKIRLTDVTQALREGFADFNANPSFVPFLIIIYPVFALLLTLVMVGENQLYLAFPMVAGFTLLGPVVSTGLFEMSRHRERGLTVSWRSSFDFIHTSAFAPIAALSIVMMLLYVAWLYMAEFLYFGLFSSDPPASVGEFFGELWSTRHGAALVMYGTAIGFLCASTALAISVIAFPLLLDKPTSAMTAVITSVKAVVTNPLAMAAWGGIVVALLAAGAALFLVGLAAVLPILGHATWHLYRKVIE